MALLLFVLPFILFANTMTADTTYYIRKDGTVVKGFVHRPTISIKLINDTVVLTILLFVKKNLTNAGC